MEVRKIMNKEEYINILKCFESRTLFCSVPGGVGLYMIANGYSNTIKWEVLEGDHETWFDNFNDAIDYYLENS